MKISIVLAVAALANSTAVLKSAPKNCEGFEDADFVVLGGNSPDVIPIPGEIEMDIHTLFRHDLPADMVLKMDLTMLEPFPLDVPCLNGLGSCEYDFCKILVDIGVLNNLMVGSYKSTATFYGKSTPENKVGCLE